MVSEVEENILKTDAVRFAFYYRKKEAIGFSSNYSSNKTVSVMI